MIDRALVVIAAVGCVVCSLLPVGAVIVAGEVARLEALHGAK